MKRMRPGVSGAAGILLGAMLAILGGCGAEPGPPPPVQPSQGVVGQPRRDGREEASARGDANGDLVTVHYHERVPYMYREGDRVRGLTADRAAEVLEAAEIAYEWRETPPRRQIEILKAGRGRDVLLGWFRNEEREAFAQFSLPLYRDRPTVALARAGVLDPMARPSVDSVLKRPGLRLLVRDGYSYGEFLDRRIAEMSGNRMVTTVDNLAMARMIGAGRADYFFIAEEEAQVVLEQSGVAPGELVEVHFADMPPGNERCLMFSRGIERGVVERVDRAIGAKLRFEGEEN